MPNYIRDVQEWSIYHSRNCACIPDLLNHWVVVAAKDRDSALCFVIYSELSRFLEGKPEILACQVEIDKAEHPFLRRNSYVDCGKECKLYAWDLQQRECNVSKTVRQKICTAVEQTDLLAPKYKKLVLLSGRA